VRGWRAIAFEEEPLDERKIAKQAAAAVALDHFVHRASEVDIQDVEPEVLAYPRGVGHHCRIGAEELRGNRVLFRLECQVALQGFGRLARATGGADAVGAGELGHDQPAAAEVTDESPEDGIGHAGHGSQHRRRGDAHRTD